MRKNHPCLENLGKSHFRIYSEQETIYDEPVAEIFKLMCFCSGAMCSMWLSLLLLFSQHSLVRIFPTNFQAH